jgi:hypothetical protein
VIALGTGWSCVGAGELERGREWAFLADQRVVSSAAKLGISGVEQHGAEHDAVEWVDTFGCQIRFQKCAEGGRYLQEHANPDVRETFLDVSRRRSRRGSDNRTSDAPIAYLRSTLNSSTSAGTMTTPPPSRVREPSNPAKTEVRKIRVVKRRMLMGSFCQSSELSFFADGLVARSKSIRSCRGPLPDGTAQQGKAQLSLDRTILKRDDTHAVC